MPLQNYLIESQYFPPIAFFALCKEGLVTLESCENYQKRSFRNKCVLIGSQGVQTLTVPLQKGKHQQQKISDVRISYDEPWHLRHLQAIRSAYGNAPYFDYYFPSIETILESTQSHLWSLNLNIITELIQMLKLNAEIEISARYQKTLQNAHDLRNQINPRNYKEITCPPYTQLFTDRLGFIPNVSILDLIFCLGPEASVVLHNFSPLGIEE